MIFKILLATFFSTGTMLTFSQFNPNQGGGTLPHCWFSLNNSETVKAVTLAFCSIQQHFIKNIHTIFGISNAPQSPDIGNNLDESFPIYGFLVNPL